MKRNTRYLWILVPFMHSVFAMGDISSLEKTETVIDKLKVGAEKYVKKFDKEYDKWAKKFIETVEQKMTDSKLTEDATLQQLALDFVTDNKHEFSKEPSKVDKNIILNVARMIKYLNNKNVVWKDWKAHEEKINLWVIWFMEKTKDGMKDDEP